jgi:hypothetical protein
MSKDKQTGVCEHCGAKFVEYRYGFNKGLAVFLAKLYEAGKEVRTNDLGLTYPQRTNSQKVAYWGLGKQVMNDESRIKAGWWIITEKGKAFVEGRITIQKYCYTLRAKVVRHDGPETRFSDVHEGYKYREHFREQARKQIKPIEGPDGQGSLF